jgi:hypothetical protein
LTRPQGRKSLPHNVNQRALCKNRHGFEEKTTFLVS